MIHSEPVRTAAHRTRWTVLAGLVVVSGALIGVLEHHSSAASPSPIPSISAASPLATPPFTHRGPGKLPGGPGAAAGEADGVVPAGATIFDNGIPAVGNLKPALLGALRKAATDAARNGVTFYVNSGWRSPKYQEQLLHEAISKYGSEKAAARWVATPDTSAHVSGEAVDIGHADAAAWLSKHGTAYGLCQIYRNEPWHYELRPDAIDHSCPAMYADPTHDPRMQQ